MSYLLDISNLIGNFTWNFGQKFHIETSEGCFEWSDPEYGGSGKIVEADSYDAWICKQAAPYGRDKGKHPIGKYCGHGNVS